MLNGGGYCGPQELHIVQIMNGEKELKEQKNRHYVPVFSLVCFVSNMSTPLSGKEAIERKGILGVFCLSTTEDKGKSA